VEQMKHLQQLNIEKNKVEDLSPLTELVFLDFLGVKNNMIQSFRPITNLYKLRTFIGDGNRLLADPEYCPENGKSKMVNLFCQKFLLNP
jgi:Leucine-rich repeat (LRR) protein